MHGRSTGGAAPGVAGVSGTKPPKSETIGPEAETEVANPATVAPVPDPISPADAGRRLGNNCVPVMRLVPAPLQLEFFEALFGSLAGSMSGALGYAAAADLLRRTANAVDLVGRQSKGRRN